MAVLSASLVLSVFQGVAVAEESVAVLEPGETREVAIHASEPTIIEVDLAPRASAVVTITALESEIRVALRGSGAKPDREFANPIHGMPVTEVFRLYGTADGPARFSVFPTIDAGQQPHRISVGLADLEPDPARSRAEADEQAAKQFLATGDDAQLPDAQAALQRAARRWAEIGDADREALALLMQSFVVKQLGDKAATIDLYRQALALQTSLDPWLYLSSALYSMDGSGRDATASLLADGLARSEALHDVAATSALQSATGLLHHMFGELDDAQAWYERALDSAQAAGYLTQQAILANNIAGIHYVRGNPEQAVAYFDRAIAAHERRGDRASIGEVLYNKGSLFFRLGEVQAALPLLLDALDENTAHESDSEQVAYTTARIGSALLYLGNFTQARNFLNRALQLHLEHESWNQYARVLQLIGKLELAEGRLDEAMAIHRDTVARFRDIGRRSGEIDANLALADDYLAAGRAGNAIEHAERALEMALAEGDARREASARLTAGRAHYRRGDHDVAESLLLEADAYFEDNELLQLRSQAQVALGYLHLDRGDTDAALGHARLAQDAVNDLRAKIPPADLRARFFAAQLEPYDLEIEIFMRQHLAGENPASAIDALFAAERAGARTLQELIGPGYSRGVDAERDIGLQQKINAKLIAARRFAAQSGDAERQRAERDLQALLLRAEGDAWLQNSPVKRADIERLQHSLGEGAALVRYWIGDERGYWWLLTSRAVTAGRIADPAALATIARRLHTSLKRPGNLDRDSLDALATQLLPADLPDNGQVFVVADGVLSVVPFQLLLMSQRGTGDARELAYLPNAMALLGSSAGDPPDSAFVVADPIYNEADNRLPAARRGARSQQPASPITGEQSYRRLASTADEVAVIQRHIGADRITVLGGAAANKANLVALPELDADLLHFATHGFADAQLPEMSSLVLSTYGADGAIEDRYLTLKEIYQLPINARLVVLSACDTHIGRELRGEGVLGLSRGFVASGADGVVSTLWPVSDKATALFMEQFYDALLAEGQPPAAALAAAQQSMRAIPRYRDPFFWAGFVLLGQ
jgi:CHAT domain-containing protein/Tfp pilus assembly protein PilF